MKKNNTEKMIDLMKLGTISIPKYIFCNYKKLGVTDHEFILIMYLIN